MTFAARLAATILCASCLTGTAQAMAPEEFARMNNDDEATFVALLVEASAKMLKANGQPNQAAKTIALFHDPSQNGGVPQLAFHLRTLNNLNNRNATNPNNRAPVYQVEDAMVLTLKDAGIHVSVSYLLDADKDFRPSGPPRSLVSGQ